MTFKILFCAGAALMVFLPPVLAAKWKKRRLARRVEDETCFFLRYSPVMPVLLSVGAVLPYAGSVTLLFTEDIREPGVLFGAAIFLAFALMVMLAAVFCILSEVKVETDVMTRYELPLPVRQYRFRDITSVRYVENLRRGGAA